MTQHALMTALAAGETEHSLALLTAADFTVTPELHDAVMDLARTKAERFQAEIRLRRPDLFRWAGFELQCAILAVCSIKELGGMLPPTQLTAFANYADLLHVIVTRREPEWIRAWCAFLLKAEDCVTVWPQLRRLVRDGYCARPDDPRYGLGLIAGDRVCLRQGVRQLVTVPEFLLANPELLDDVWQLFEIEGDQTVSLANGDDTWPAALATLAESGHLYRERLLVASLSALERGFAHYRAGWFSRFHEHLQPTADERLLLAEAYGRLLASPIPPTVSLALKALAELRKAGTLDAGLVLRQLTPALTAKAKASVLAALELLAYAVSRQPEHTGAAVLLAAQALAHAKTEVQAAALEFIERHAPQPSAALLQALSDVAPCVAPSLRPRLASLRGQVQPASSSLQPVAAAHVAAPGATEASCPEPAGRQVDGVRDLAELVELAARLLENPGPATDVERFLDGLSRLCAETPADLPRRLAPLAKRAMTVLGRAAPWWPVPNAATQLLVSGLVLAWHGGLGQRLPDTIQLQYRRRSLAVPETLAAWWQQLAETPCHAVSRLLTDRGGELAQRVSRRQAQPLLAFPTHGAWLDPVVMLRRLDGLLQQGRQPDDADLAQALLRLAADAGPCATARSMCERLPSFNGKTSLLLALGSNNCGDDGLSAAHDRLRAAACLAACSAQHTPPPAVGLRIWAEHDTYTYWHADVKALTPSAATVTTNLFLQHLYDESASASDLIHSGHESVPIASHRADWEYAAVPVAPFIQHLRQARIYLRQYMFEEVLAWNRLTESLLAADMRLDCAAQILLGLGLTSHVKEERELACDVLVAAIADGRLTPLETAGILCPFIRDGAPRLARWIEPLQQAARTSPQHAATLAQGIMNALRGDPANAPRDLAAILGLLAELLHDTGIGFNDPEAVAYVKACAAGSTGKCAKNCKALLALNHT